MSKEKGKVKITEVVMDEGAIPESFKKMQRQNKTIRDILTALFSIIIGLGMWALMVWIAKKIWFA